MIEHVAAEEPPPVGWVQSPSDDIWHFLQPTGEQPDAEGEGVAACGLPIPAAAQGHVADEPGFPACMPCTVQLIDNQPGSGWLSI